MALVSARYTIQAVEVLTMLMRYAPRDSALRFRPDSPSHSAQLYCLCMAVDLRVMDLCFRQAFADSMPGLLSHHFGAFLDAAALHQLARDVLSSIYRRLEHTASMDTQYRFADAFNNATSVVVDALVRASASGDSLAAVAAWKQASAEATSALYVKSRDSFFAQDAGAAEFLGATAGLYTFVRRDLGVKARRGDVKAGGHQGESSLCNLAKFSRLTLTSLDA